MKSVLDEKGQHQKFPIDWAAGGSQIFLTRGPKFLSAALIVYPIIAYNLAFFQNPAPSLILKAMKQTTLI